MFEVLHYCLDFQRLQLNATYSALSVSLVTCPGPKVLGSHLIAVSQGQAWEGSCSMRGWGDKKQAEKGSWGQTFYFITSLRWVSANTFHNTNAREMDKFTREPAHQSTVIPTGERETPARERGPEPFSFLQVPLLQAPSFRAFLRLYRGCNTDVGGQNQNRRSVYLTGLIIKLILRTQRASLGWKCFSLDGYFTLIFIRGALSVSFLIFFLSFDSRANLSACDK